METSDVIMRLTKGYMRRMFDTTSGFHLSVRYNILRRLSSDKPCPNTELTKLDLYSYSENGYNGAVI